MSFAAKMITDSVAPTGKRLKTMLLRYPRFIHSELMTHGRLSKNASSSRAIPVERMIASLRADPAMPVSWGSKQKGMQAGPELTGHALERVQTEWLLAMEHAIEAAQSMLDAGLHKQVANRVLEPWAHMTTLVTGTEFENLYALRRHKDAQPEFKVLADLMWEAEQESVPSFLDYGQWHLPFILDSDWEAIRARITMNGVLRLVPTYDQMAEIALKVSVARCARTSYDNMDGKRSTIDEDIALYDRLVNSWPVHASPAEHQGMPDRFDQKDAMMSRAAAGKGHVADSPDYSKEFAWLPNWERPELHGNFVGFIQHRFLLPNHYIPG